MTRPQNIAVVTVEWSDDYDGGDLSGHYGGEGNERYIFRPYRGQFYGYFPPNGKSGPVAKVANDWLIFFVSRPARGAPSVVVGWYEGASIVGDRPRPDADALGPNSEGGPYSYSAIASRAVSIPAAARDCVLPRGMSLRSFTFLRLDGVDRQFRSKLIKSLVAYYERVSEGNSANRSTGSGRVPVDPVLKKQVEEAAVKAVKADFRRGYRFLDKQKVPGTGYDLEFTDRHSGEIWCIEVKGTAGARDAFFITRTERRVGRDMLADERAGSLRRWRLALVTLALDPALRSIEYFEAAQLDQLFDFQCLQWQATAKSETA